MRYGVKGMDKVDEKFAAAVERVMRRTAALWLLTASGAALAGGVSEQVPHALHNQPSVAVACEVSAQR